MASKQRSFNNHNRKSSQPNMRKPEQRQADLYNTGMPGDNPFQSMYQATIGQRAQTSNGHRPSTNAQTPNQRDRKLAKTGDTWYNNGSKSATRLAYTAKREQNRRFGEYNGEDGLEGAGPAQAIWQQSPFKALPTGY